MTQPIEDRPPLRVIDLLFDEDCETAFFVGDVDECAMRVALALALVTDLDVDRDEAIACAVAAKYSREWMRYDPADELGERMLRCEPGDDGATRFSILTGYAL